MILRRVTARHGRARVDVIRDPRADFGEHGLRKLSRRDDGTWIGELGESRMSWVGGPGREPAGRRARGQGATLQAVGTELTVDGYCYRYRPDERPLGESEDAFLLCAFLMALAYAQQGEHVTAARWFERNRAACGPPGLCSEEGDVS